MFNNANVLVTGGTGLVGVNLIRRLLEMGANVTATVHRRGAVIHDDRIRYVHADLRSAADCAAAVTGIDFVFMCAGKTSGAGAAHESSLAQMTSNVSMNVSMLDAAYEKGVKKFLFISSSTVYPVTDHPVAESEVTNEFFKNYFIVGWTNRFIEIVCDMYATKVARPLPLCVVRPANIYGEYDDFDLVTSHVIPSLIRKVVERQNPIEVWGDGDDVREFIYVQDFIDGMLLAMHSSSRAEPINISTGEPRTVKALLDEILKVDQFTDANVVFNSSKPTMIRKRLIDTAKATELLGFRPRVSLEEGLRRTVAWYRSADHASLRV